ncbi:chaperone protein dnaJ 11, chloroplastic-like [Andrographis paniculata]|uniref:chaperone protein dnaJ 11, chloroplastic-like n=1 Tax=Andrographis paniculata TaxID=175694 RepID=UPI0021E70485|nr:chaperone protein dnaJ 11, chloroplastic-like [Andrographis paniculata]
MSFTAPNRISGHNLRSIPPPYSSSIRQSLRVSAVAGCAGSTAERGKMTELSQAASLYEVLGIRTCATLPEIKSAYRKLARVVHPDIASSRGEDGESSGNEFMRVHAAYSTLSDPEKRAMYDSSLFRRRRTAVSLGSGYSGAASPRRRTWETDQCW